ncbi:MAG: hypothetical protein IJ559_02840 [Prevotella sp.]|nr:hypothetical protein [Prevotella sp.]
MKKYLMMGIAALTMGAAFTSCSNDDFEEWTQEKADKAKYDQIFLSYIGGSVAPTQTWGFSSTINATRAQNANGNEWADVKNSTGFGGWQVPDTLTTGQKLRVQAYFQANPNLTFEDPQWNNFFVQQVYKGRTSAGSNSTEQVIAADGSTYNSSNMNLLTVGANDTLHINNFNNGDCSVYANVLDNGSDIAAGNVSYHSDKIMLMVDINDTGAFGYHETGSSMHHNNKAALVAASVIDAWAVAHKDSLESVGKFGEDVTDSWNRSFLGFDLAIREGAEAYATDGSGNVVYADYSQAPTAPAYAWDGENIIMIKSYTEDQWGNKIFGDYLPAYQNILKGTEAIGWLNTNKNFYVSEDAITLTGEANASEKPISEVYSDNVLVFKDVKVQGASNNKAHVLNLKRINELVAQGYLPVNNKSLTEWVKVGKSDGYFSDWIVTLTEAKRVEAPYDLRIIAEDLSANDASDFDFNDVVFDVKYDASNAYIKLQAAGGTLKLRIDGNDEWEVHKLFGVDQNYMVNTNAKAKGLKGNARDKQPVEFRLGRGINNAEEANSIKIEVYKNNVWQLLTAVQGEPATKLAVTVDYNWLDERTSIKDEYPTFVQWATTNEPNLSKWWSIVSE